MAISRRVMMALPTITNGLRARSDRFGGGGSCSGSSAARGLRGEMGGLSLIEITWILPVQSRPDNRLSGQMHAPTSMTIAEYGKKEDSSQPKTIEPGAGRSPTHWYRQNQKNSTTRR